MSKLIVANWKLNPMTADEAVALASKISTESKHTVVICPPTAFIGLIKYTRVGAQDCSPQIKGAYTGQTSPAELASLGVKFCIVGHSERRGMGEDDSLINAKVRALLDYKITPILCVGFGTTVQEDELEVTEVLRDQINAGLAGIDSSKVVIAYEPVWAISNGNPYATKKVATPEHAEQIALYIHTKHKPRQVLYGGSVNGSNFDSFLSEPHIDGLLVGGASLLPDDFNKIIGL